MEGCFYNEIEKTWEDCPLAMLLTSGIGGGGGMWYARPNDMDLAMKTPVSKLMSPSLSVPICEM